MCAFSSKRAKDEESWNIVSAMPQHFVSWLAEGNKKLNLVRSEYLSVSNSLIIIFE